MIAMETIEKLSRKLPMITVLAGEDLGQYSQAKKFSKQIGRSQWLIILFWCRAIIKMLGWNLESMPFFADEKGGHFDHFRRYDYC